MRTPEEEMIGAQAPDENGLFELTRGMKRYELTNHLGNVLSVITDTKQAVYNNPPSVLSYYQSEVISYMDYYAYGAILSGRCFNNTHYRFSYNKQEKTDEISGAGNHTTAKYWEYDTRLGRRWNLDPIFNTDISRYAVNGNNPIYYLDPKGDFKTKFGANVYKFFHGGTVTQAQYGDRKGEYYVHKRVDGGKGAKGDGKTNLDEVVVAEEVRWNWGDGGKDHPGNVLDNGVDFVQRNASNAWNSPLARYIIPDYVTISGSFQTSSGIYMNEELTFTLMLRGKDPGLYFNTTTGFGAVTSVGVDVGCSVGKGYYLGDARKLSSSMLGGWQGSGSAGVGLKAIAGGSLNGGVDVGFDDNGQPVTITGKVGVSVGVGVSTPVLQGGLGTGKATNAIPIFKF
jgi:RHS repeat-associated protein